VGLLYCDGLIALSGCPLGDIPQALTRHDKTGAAHLASQYRELFGADNFYLELNHHNLPEHDTLRQQLADLGKELNIPLVATNNVHYALPDDRRLQDILTCIKHHVTLDNAHDLLYPNAERYLKSHTTMAERFAKYPDAIANTEAIAGRCSFALDKVNTTLPDFPVPNSHTVDSYLRKLTFEGAARRNGIYALGKDSAVVKQLEHELALIAKLNLSGYFLIVWASLPSTRSDWNCCSSDFFLKTARKRPTSISISPTTVVRKRFSMSITQIRPPACRDGLRGYHLSRTVGCARGWQGAWLLAQRGRPISQTA
jgi:DNA polymerase-3 subunit alpha